MNNFVKTNIETNTHKSARQGNLRHPRVRFQSFADEVALLLSLWVHVVLYSGEFLTKTTAAPSQEVVEGRS
jgi:hypothetical protein